jgi:hypothetical protein
VRYHLLNTAMRILSVMLVACGIVGLVAWLAAPWLIDSGAQPAAQVTTAANTQPAEAPLQNSAPKDAELQNERRSSPQPSPPARHIPPALTTRYGIVISTTPSAATAMLDNRPEVSCKTPCLLLASRGPHTIAISQAGYQTEYSHAEVADNLLQLPRITLRPFGGLLMLTSIPPGARISLDGRDSEQVTPARVELPSGIHKVTVEKDGKQAEQQVEVTAGIISYLNIPLDR